MPLILPGESLNGVDAAHDGAEQVDVETTELHDAVTAPVASQTRTTYQPPNRTYRFRLFRR